MNGKSQAVQGERERLERRNMDSRLMLTYEATRFLLHSCCLTPVSLRSECEKTCLASFPFYQNVCVDCKSQTWKRVGVFSVEGMLGT